MDGVHGLTARNKVGIGGFNRSPRRGQSQNTWADVNNLNYTFNDVVTQNLAWAEIGLGGW